MANSNISFRDESSGKCEHSLATYIAIALWTIVRETFFRFSPRHMYFFRNYLLRIFGARIEPHVKIYPCVRIEYPWNLVMRKYASIGRQALIYNLELIDIGEFVTISQRAHLCGGTHDYSLKSFPLVRKPIIIGNGVWIAADAFISAGVTIGDNAIIGARAVVTKDMPQKMICAGNPCRVIKERPDVIGVQND